MITVDMIASPSSADWMEVKRRALITIGKNPVNEPTETWKHRILEARHSPIRSLMFSFAITCPSWVSVHLARHIHAQPYIKSQRNDRQNTYDRNKAPQDTPVDMIWDINAEELMTIANKRLCMQASAETREVITKIRDLVYAECPEFRGLLVPACEYYGGVCHEMTPCVKHSKEILLLMGRSGSGKSTIADILERKYSKTMLRSYTTRPPRFNDDTHIFISEHEFQHLEDIVAYTEFDGYRYAATTQQVNESDVYVIDPVGVKTFKENYRGLKKPIVVYLDVSPDECVNRMEQRGNSTISIMQRVTFDKTVFDNIDDICDYIIPNNTDNINDTVNRIRRAMKW